MVNLGGILQVRFRNSVPSSTPTTATLLGSIVAGTAPSRLPSPLSIATQPMQRCYIEPHANSQQLTVVSAAQNLQVRPVPITVATISDKVTDLFV